MQKIDFFTGKGGTGKSTNAIIFALKKAKNKKILLCSLDPAHNLKDILLVNSFEEISKKIPDLYIQEPSISEMLKEYLKEIEDQLKSNHSYLSSFNLLNDFGVIKHSPGMEEYAIFYTFQKLFNNNKDKKETLIFDMPPTALSIRFFSLPKLSMIWLDKLIDLRYKIINKKKIIDKIKKENSSDDKVLLNLLEQKQNYQKIHNVLIHSTIHVVLNPEPISINESINLIKDLEELGYKDIVIHLNKYRKEIPEKIWELEQKYKIINIPFFDEMPVGINRLTLITDAGK